MKISSTVLIVGALVLAAPARSYAVNIEDCKPDVGFCFSDYFVGSKVLPDQLYFGSIPRLMSNHDAFTPDSPTKNKKSAKPAAMVLTGAANS